MVITSIYPTTVINYPITYGDSDYYMEVSEKKVLENDFLFPNNYPVLSVIHNLIIRSTSVSESEYLKSLKLDAPTLQKVYIYEILILRAICGGYFEKKEKLIAPIKDKTEVIYAYNDLKYYLQIFKKMTTQMNDKLPELVFSQDLILNSISNGKDKITSKVVCSKSTNVCDAPILEFI